MVFWNLRSSAKSAEKLILSARKALVRKTIVVILPGMSTIQEIESAVSSLSQKELAAFREWFAGFDAAAWDKQFEDDVRSGKLDALADEALRDLSEGRCTDL